MEDALLKSTEISTFSSLSPHILGLMEEEEVFLEEPTEKMFHDFQTVIWFLSMYEFIQCL